MKANPFKAILVLREHYQAGEDSTVEEYEAAMEELRLARPGLEPTDADLLAALGVVGSDPQSILDAIQRNADAKSLFQQYEAEAGIHKASGNPFDAIRQMRESIRAGETPSYRVMVTAKEELRLAQPALASTPTSLQVALATVGGDPQEILDAVNLHAEIQSDLQQYETQDGIRKGARKASGKAVARRTEQAGMDFHRANKWFDKAYAPGIGRHTLMTRAQTILSEEEERLRVQVVAFTSAGNHAGATSAQRAFQDLRNIESTLLTERRAKEFLAKKRPS